MIAGVVIVSTPLVPYQWQLTGNGWAVIFPLVVVCGCHILFPVSDTRNWLADRLFCWIVPFNLVVFFFENSVLFPHSIFFDTDAFCNIDRSQSMAHDLLVLEGQSGIGALAAWTAVANHSSILSGVVSEVHRTYQSPEQSPCLSSSPYPLTSCWP